MTTIRVINKTDAVIQVAISIISPPAAAAIQDAANSTPEFFPVAPGTMESWGRRGPRQVTIVRAATVNGAVPQTIIAIPGTPVAFPNTDNGPFVVVTPNNIIL